MIVESNIINFEAVALTLITTCRILFYKNRVLVKIIIRKTVLTMFQSLYQYLKMQLLPNWQILQIWRALKNYRIINHLNKIQSINIQKVYKKWIVWVWSRMKEKKVKIIQVKVHQIKKLRKIIIPKKVILSTMSNNNILIKIKITTIKLVTTKRKWLMLIQ